MDLSVNKLGKQNSIKFKGMKGDLSKNNTPVFKFYPPAYNKNSEKAELQIAPLKTNEISGEYFPPSSEDFLSIEFEDLNPLEIGQANIKQFSNGFAYRYKISSKNNENEFRYIIDSFKTVNISDKENERANIIEQGANYGITPKTGTMRHSFIDSDAILKNGKLMPTDKDFVRNHFNKLGGSIKGLTYLLTKTNELEPYRYVMSTPDIGTDEISSHKYWPNNQYQCTNLEDFKEFIFEMYKQGKGYVADGAFTSQGLQSPMVQHVLKWGEKSPFYNMLKIDSTLKLGVLPDRTPMEDVDDYDYIGVKIINNPQGIDYNSKKPTYIQFFDTRLVQEGTKNSNKLIKQYDKNPDDHYDITNHQNSILLYHFEIQKNDQRRLKEFQTSNNILLKDVKNLDEFLTFPHFSIVSKNHASGANFWDGNRDIIKMNLSNPNGTEANKKGFEDARSYLFGVATYWTELVQSDLILKTAMMNDSERAKVAKNNDIDNYEEIKSENSILSMKYPVLEQKKTIRDYIRNDSAKYELKNFPLQSIETDLSLSAIFSEPEFNKEFFDDKTVDLIEEIAENAINRAIPEKYKSNEEYKTYVVKTYANQVIRNILIGALNPKALDNKGNVNLDILREVSLSSLGANDAPSVENERRIVESRIKSGISPTSIFGIVDKMSEDLKKIKLKDFKLAEAIVLKGKAGLNWRFDAAKDVGDLDSVKDGTVTFDTVWNGNEQTPGVQDFWTNFVSNIKTYNPSAYIIAEITNFGDFVGNRPLSMYDSKLSKAYNDKWAIASKKENDFLEKSGATTTSNYGYYFNRLSEFVGVNPENNDIQLKAGEVNKLKDKTEELLSNTQPNIAMLSHVFVDNHDKPRVLHVMPIDSELYNQGNLQYVSDDKKEKITNLTGRSDYENIPSSAAAVGLAIQDLINEKYKDNPELKDKLSRQLRLLTNGQKDEISSPNYRRADAFGRTPYEISIKDMFTMAGINNENEIENFIFEFLKKAIHYETKLWEVINALIGVPTLFNGTEFFQTGYESSSKNIYVANRNQVLHDRKDDLRYKPYYKRMQNITSLYKKPDLSAVRNGFPISGEVQYFDNLAMWPIYRYDEKGSKVFTIITNNGVPESKPNVSSAENKVYNLKSIELNFKEENRILEDGMPLRRIYLKDNSYVEDPKKYKVEKYKEGDNIKYRIVADDKDKTIPLSGTVETFYFPKSQIKNN